MTDKNERKSKIDEVGDTLKGLVVLGIIGYFAWGYFFGASDKPPAQNPQMTLAEFKDLSASQRSGYVSSAISALDGAQVDDASFQRCMSDFSARKSASLLFADVLGWCENERQLNRAEFEGHFDELAWGDLSIEAKSFCEVAVKEHLLSPASAEFAFIDARISHYPRQEYRVASYVDSQNAAGAMLRTHFSCTIRFTGSGRPGEPSSWTVPSVALND